MALLLLLLVLVVVLLLLLLLLVLVVLLLERRRSTSSSLLSRSAFKFKFQKTTERRMLKHTRQRFRKVAPAPNQTCYRLVNRALKIWRRARPRRHCAS